MSSESKRDQTDLYCWETGSQATAWKATKGSPLQRDGHIAVIIPGLAFDRLHLSARFCLSYYVLTSAWEHWNWGMTAHFITNSSLPKPGKIILKKKKTPISVNPIKGVYTIDNQLISSDYPLIEENLEWNSLWISKSMIFINEIKLTAKTF